MNVDMYLQRIQAFSSSNADLSYLTHLQFNHMLSVPFENLDVMRQVPIILDLERFYEKVVLRKRGGFCYELNGLFYWLLQQMGYDVHLISGTVRKPDGTWALKDSHAACIVQLDQPYLVDVGFGDSIRIPIPLTGEEVNDGGTLYRVTQTNSHSYYFQRKRNESWITLYSFDNQPKKLLDFSPMCDYNQTSPESRFTQESITSVATENGRITLLNDTLTSKEGKAKTEYKVIESEKDEVLSKYFGLKTE
ncbi:arylamine N-acetyltransferase family protein [Salicibibacter kimchii]|uniref:Arylamine N-acetyltransferase n=1 Tax=Salicibibacter kimchii TaxID=2099786 RepID=A0A345C170_9BACI|nr:arylamine N-acetyltransferase [Salicibibacter kimchii]AXF56951.1 arylamine N-acetyltransferase [Salicibibacter kimchii]